jgi:prophage antirepressor-like protein
LGYKNPQETIREKCKGARKTLTPTNGGYQTVNYIPEGDLYRLIVSSKLPQAEKFERWVFDDVLPSIKRNGGAANCRHERNSDLAESHLRRIER